MPTPESYNLIQNRRTIPVHVRCAAALIAGLLHLSEAGATPASEPPETISRKSIPWSEVGAAAGAQYSGDGLSVTPASDGARLRCVFQRIEGEATREGLWLSSTGTDQANDRFRVMATALGRTGSHLHVKVPQEAAGAVQLPATGDISVDGRTVRFTRPGLVEEYSVSMNGVRQDFIVEKGTFTNEHKPSNFESRTGQLRVELAVEGARPEATQHGAQLILERSGRKIAYSRLKVTDATSRELPARMEVVDKSEIGDPKSELGLALLVDDADAVYPVRIDPTFSDSNWISMGGLPGTDGEVRAAVVDASGILYIGGNFSVVGDIRANRIAKWNGSHWSPLGSGMDGLYPAVDALAVSGSDLYAGGCFTNAGGVSANGIAKWNGSNWSALGSGVGGDYPARVRALAVTGGGVYAGGQFTIAGGVSANHVAKWNGSSWSPLGVGVDGGVSALAVSGSDLYVGGTVGSAGANSIARWDGSSWSALGSGIQGYVAALTVSGRVLYAGGRFTSAGGVAATNVARWDGSSWSALGSGITGPEGGAGNTVFALTMSGSDLYAGGLFRTEGEIPATNIAKWNGSAWNSVGSGVDERVYALAASGSNVYAGGEFATADGSGAKAIAKWNGSRWSALGSGMDSYVFALAVSGSDVYAGGWFTTAGAGSANQVAKWNGSGWSPLGLGLNGSAYTLAVSGSDLYAGGSFSTAGGAAASNVAKWDGSSWSALGAGINGMVTALAVSGSDLYAGGEFTTAGGVAATNIAKWNGTNWSALGSGLIGPPIDSGGSGYSPNYRTAVSALAVSGNDLYAGGRFTNAGGVSAHKIAKWNGGNWSELGSGIGDDFAHVYALAVSGSYLYVGGEFSIADGIPANNIAKWNGSTWSPLGSGLGLGTAPFSGFPVVTSLAVSGGDLYAGGWFHTAGDKPAMQIAKWNGSSWNALGSGMRGGMEDVGAVSAIALSGSDLFAGGGFTSAGGKVSAYLARAYLPDFPDLSISRSGAGVALSWPSAGTERFSLEQSPALTSPADWFPTPGKVNDDGTTRSVLVPATAHRQFFRLRLR